VVTRELVYTGVTRAKERVVLHAPRGAIAAALKEEAVRRSGLRDRIRAAK
jgi:ATP-dependent exoDNAse (exonuclease V) alpha subunit